MDLSPNDIRNYEFPNQMRGYDKEEVDSFLEQIATTLENMKQDQLKISMENDSLRAQLDILKKLEDSIKNAAIDARKNADATLANAKLQAAEIMADAKTKAQNLINSHDAKLNLFRNQFSQLEVAKISFINKIKEIIENHTQLVHDIEQNKEQYEADMPFDLNGSDETDDVPATETNTGDTDRISVTDSSEISRNTMETVGTPAKNEHIVTEEANAAEDNIEAKIAQAQADSEPVMEKPVDPELAAALHDYQNLVNKEKITEPISPDTLIGGKPEIPKQGEVVETSKKAEDIPDGFVAVHDAPPAPHNADMNSESYDEGDDTGEIDVNYDESDDEGTEHNSIDIDTPMLGKSEPQRSAVPGTSPDIAKALDDVVAKFEEEMEKAEKS